MKPLFAIPLGLLFVLGATESNAQTIPRPDIILLPRVPRPIEIVTPPPANVVDITPFGVGGIRYNVTPAGFEIEIPAYVRMEGAQAVVPYDGRVRPGCFISSPWLPVTHDNGFADFIPNLRIDWTGILFPRSGYHAPILNLQAAIRHPDGNVEYKREVIDSGRLPRLTPIAQVTPEAILYQGVLDNDVLSRRVAQAFDVGTGDEIRVSLCDLMGGSELRVRSLVLQSVPYEQQ